MNFAKKNTNVENVLLVDGLTRTGKFFLAKIVSELENVDFFQYLQVLEQIPYIYGLGGMSEDASIALIKSSVDYGVYNQILGRSLNHRVLDRSSIYNSSNPELYLKRQFEIIEKDEIIHLIRSNNKKHLFCTHNVLTNIDIMLKAYPDLKMIHIIRNPVDLVFSWYKKKYGKINSYDRLNLNPDISKNGIAVPWYHNEWGDNDNGMNEVDIIIKSIKTLFDLINKKTSCMSTTDKDKIFIIKYEKLIMDPVNEMKKLSCFLGSSINNKVRQALLREGLPNTKIMNNHKENSKIIYGLASNESSKILRKMEKDYLTSKVFYGLDML